MVIAPTKNKNKKTVELLQHQADFVTSLEPKFIGLCGGYRAGKTVSLCHKGIYMALMNPGYDGCLMMPTGSMCKRVLMPTMEEALEATGANVITKLVKSDPKYVITTPYGVSNIFILSAENYERAAGLSLAWFGIDEFDLVDMDIADASWRMMVSRLTNGPHMQGFTTSTPEGYKWLYRFFDEEVKKAEVAGKPLTDRKLIRARTHDNPYITADYIATLESQFPPALLKAYLEGEFVSLQGSKVYWKFDKDANTTDKTVKDFEGETIHIGQDFNKNINAGVVSIIKNNQVYAVDELFGARDTQELADTIKRRFKWHYENNAIKFYPDASGFEGIQNLKRNFPEFSKEGTANFIYGDKNPAVERRVASVNEKLLPTGRAPECFVNPNTCPELYKGLTQQVYDKNQQPDKKSGIDHAVDGFGYFLQKRFPVAEPRPIPRIILA